MSGKPNTTDNMLHLALYKQYSGLFIPMSVDLDNVSIASRDVSVSSSSNQTMPPKPTTKKKQNFPGMPGDASACSSSKQTMPPKPTTKKKRNLPGIPDAKVIALSPKTLMVMNRFVYKICNKGFQRD
ncbi:hypothetical protein RJT34_13508 [Clitoria ternatea]|uniref:Uncharacterized protein n=1 Tax=Clitoria ternatea TaxID=43366 RepID=A0AAN9PLI3_CLITE